MSFLERLIYNDYTGVNTTRDYKTVGRQSCLARETKAKSRHGIPIIVISNHISRTFGSCLSVTQ